MGIAEIVGRELGWTQQRHAALRGVEPQSHQVVRHLDRHSVGQRLMPGSQRDGVELPGFDLENGNERLTPEGREGFVGRLVRGFQRHSALIRHDVCRCVHLGKVFPRT